MTQLDQNSQIDLTCLVKDSKKKLIDISHLCSVKLQEYLQWWTATFVHCADNTHKMGYYWRKTIMDPRLSTQSISNLKDVSE